MALVAPQHTAGSATPEPQDIPASESGSDTSLRGQHLNAFNDLPAGAALVVSVDVPRLLALCLGSGPARRAVAEASVAQLGLDLTRAKTALVYFDPVERALALWLQGDLPAPDGVTLTPLGDPSTQANSPPTPAGPDALNALRLTDDIYAAGRQGLWVAGNERGLRRSLARIAPAPLALDGTLSAQHRQALSAVNTEDALLVATAATPPTLQRVLPIVGLSHAALVLRTDLSVEVVVGGTPTALGELSALVGEHVTAWAGQASLQLAAALAGPGGPLLKPALSAVVTAVREAAASAPAEGVLRLQLPALPLPLLFALWSVAAPHA